MSRLTDAQRLCVGLMAHDPSDPFRQGYSLGSALIATQGQFDLTTNEVAVVAELVVRPLLHTAIAVQDSVGGVQSLRELDDVLTDFGVAR